MPRTRSSRASSAASAQHDVENLAHEFEALSLASPLGKQYRVSGSPAASAASAPSNSAKHKNSTSHTYDEGSSDEDETPTASSQSTVTQRVPSARRRHSAPGQQDESASCAPRAPPPPDSRSATQSAPPNIEKNASVTCSAITKENKPCRNKTTKGALCHKHRANDSPSAAPRVERTANAFLKRWELGWLQAETWNTLAELLNAPPDATDNKGYIYSALVMGTLPPNEMHIKIGRTTDLVRRMGQWRRSCPSHPLCLDYSRSTRYYVRLEKIVLLVLRDLVDHQAYLTPEFPDVAPPERRRDSWGCSATMKPKAEVCEDCESIHIEVFRFDTRLVGGGKLDGAYLCSFVSTLCESICALLNRDCPESSSEEE
ncbi:uncharacterized protein PHACADRAFT_256943 [Phanerochaete carnosa HHB-10118-sp]|uniref:DUF1766-domain-containing protein n=1 Tax=Phanerochaete carnosa (strain HHB-10118-sp) TaxID=650164 RepID=K5VWN6_PHACS|nr:uncharacterized protein PHACADRAFT_256943 [Phanerochaete carnosa HHB-10118-sp]EKM55963.1 hypothetical protein PHACADRAFT_256943 [Phanerochaete carnosa HHB-10118-sp]